MNKYRVSGTAGCGYDLIGETGSIQQTSTLVGREGVRDNCSLHMFCLCCCVWLVQAPSEVSLGGFAEIGMPRLAPKAIRVEQCCGGYGTSDHGLLGAQM